MTFRERYYAEQTWSGRVLVMEIYHLAMCQRVPNWTLSGTAQEFDVSIGLVSENLRLANAIHANESLIKIPSRQDALRRVNGHSVATRLKRSDEELD